jgi:hypothetical protein
MKVRNLVLKLHGLIGIVMKLLLVVSSLTGFIHHGDSELATEASD